MQNYIRYYKPLLMLLYSVTITLPYATLNITLLYTLTTVLSTMNAIKMSIRWKYLLRQEFKRALKIQIYIGVIREMRAQPTRACHRIENNTSRDNTSTANLSTRLRHASGSYRRVGEEVQIDGEGGGDRDMGAMCTQKLIVQDS